MNIFVITPNSKVSIGKNKIVLEKEEDKKEVPIKEINNIFLFNGNKLGFFDVRKVKKFGIKAYAIDNFGNLRAVFLPEQKNAYVFDEKKHYDLFAFILTKQSLIAMSYIKKIDKYDYHLYNDEIRDGIERFLVKAQGLDIENFGGMYRTNFMYFYGFIRDFYAGGKFERRYEEKDPLNTTINFFHSLMIAYITSFLIDNGININQNLMNIYQEKKNYPLFSRIFFEIFKVGTTVKAAETLKNLLIKRDFSFRGALKPDGITIITKIFTEQMVHNLKLIYEIRGHLNLLRAVEEGRMRYINLLVRP